PDIVKDFTKKGIRSVEELYFTFNFGEFKDQDLDFKFIQRFLDTLEAPITLITSLPASQIKILKENNITKIIDIILEADSRIQEILGLTVEKTTEAEKEVDEKTRIKEEAEKLKQFYKDMDLPYNCQILSAPLQFYFTLPLISRYELLDQGITSIASLLTLKRKRVRKGEKHLKIISELEEIDYNRIYTLMRAKVGLIPVISSYIKDFLITSQIKTVYQLLLEIDRGIEGLEDPFLDELENLRDFFDFSRIERILKIPIFFLPQIPKNTAKYLIRASILTIEDFINLNTRKIREICKLDSKTIRVLKEEADAREILYQRDKMGYLLSDVIFIDDSKKEALMALNIQTLEEIYYGTLDSYVTQVLSESELRDIRNALRASIVFLPNSTSEQVFSLIRHNIYAIESFLFADVESLAEFTNIPESELKQLKKDFSIEGVIKERQSRGTPLTVLSFLTPKEIKVMKDYGMETIEDFYFHSPEERSELPIIDPRKIQRTISVLKSPITFIDGIDVHQIEKIVSNGISTVMDFLLCPVKDLAEMLEKAEIDIAQLKTNISLEGIENLKNVRGTPLGAILGRQKRIITALADRGITTIEDLYFIAREEEFEDLRGITWPSIEKAKTQLNLPITSISEIVDNYPNTIRPLFREGVKTLIEFLYWPDENLSAIFTDLSSDDILSLKREINLQKIGRGSIGTPINQFSLLSSKEISWLEEHEISTVEQFYFLPETTIEAAITRDKQNARINWENSIMGRITQVEEEEEEDLDEDEIYERTTFDEESAQEVEESEELDEEEDFTEEQAVIVVDEEHYRDEDEGEEEVEDEPISVALSDEEDEEYQEEEETGTGAPRVIIEEEEEILDYDPEKERETIDEEIPVEMVSTKDSPALEDNSIKEEFILPKFEYTSPINKDVLLEKKEFLDLPVSFISGVSPAIGVSLHQNQIETVFDFLYWPEHTLRETMDVSLSQIRKMKKQNIGITDSTELKQLLTFPASIVPHLSRSLKSQLDEKGIKTIEDMLYLSNQQASSLFSEEHYEEIINAKIKFQLDSLESILTYPVGFIKNVTEKLVTELEKVNIVSIKDFLQADLSTIAQQLEISLEKLKDIKFAFDIEAIIDHLETPIFFLPVVSTENISEFNRKRIKTIRDLFEIDFESIKEKISISSQEFDLIKHKATYNNVNRIKNAPLSFLPDIDEPTRRRLEKIGIHTVFESISADPKVLKEIGVSKTTLNKILRSISTSIIEKEQLEKGLSLSRIFLDSETLEAFQEWNIETFEELVIAVRQRKVVEILDEVKFSEIKETLQSPICFLSDIDADKAIRLKKGGFETIEQLIRSEPDTLVKTTGWKLDIVREILPTKVEPKMILKNKKEKGTPLTTVFNATSQTLQRLQKAEFKHLEEVYFFQRNLLTLYEPDEVEVIQKVQSLLNSAIAYLPALTSAETTQLLSQSISSLILFHLLDAKTITEKTGISLKRIQALKKKINLDEFEKSKIENGIGILEFKAVTKKEAEVLINNNIETIADLFYVANEQDFPMGKIQWSKIMDIKSVLEYPIISHRELSEMYARKIMNLADIGVSSIIKFLIWNKKELSNILELSEQEI
ncbi:MAG: hypothetical protein ACFFCQ_14405, partial [Promethearchaeota archaeon]